MVQHPESEQAQGEVGTPMLKRPWAKPVLTETPLQNVTEATVWGTLADGNTGFYQS